jgi:hypothetical protein
VALTAGTFQHQACIYHSDQQFLQMAVPFVQEGLARGEPVLTVTTPANLELVSSALGAQGGEVDYAESAYFGRRPPQRVAAFHRYWKRHAAGRHGGQVRVIAEPVWAGRSAREIAAWTRMEAALNVTLADTSIFMICPYDTRIVSPGIIADSARTHPARMDGSRSSMSPDYADPAAFARSCDAGLLPAPPAGAAAFRFEGNLRGLRQFIACRAAAHGLSRDRAAMLVQAGGEVGSYLKGGAALSATVRTWEQPGAVVCDFCQPLGRISDPFLGLRPAELEPASGDGLWLSSQICDLIEIRSAAGGCTIRLQVPSRRNEEMSQPGTRYPV